MGSRSRPRRIAQGLVGPLSLVAALAACEGSITGPGGGDSPGPRGDPGHVTVHRLNNAEYANTVRDLLGTSLTPIDDFPADDYSHGFDNIAAALSMSPIQVELYHRAARELAAEVMRDPDGTGDTSARDRILVCQPEPADPEPCVRTIAERFGERAWRRPLTEEELEGAMGLFEVARSAGADVPDGIQLILEYFLASPHFLFRFEIDPDPTSLKPRPLGDYELASRLSYFLWSSMPDDELFAAARAGILREAPELRRQIERMLADPKADAIVENFAAQWLYLRGLEEHEPDYELFPGFDDALREAMVQETSLFFEDFLASGRPVHDMLTADFSFVNGRLAEHYGFPVSAGGFERVSLEGTGRRGLLGQASILTVTSHPNRTSPVKRGQWVLEQILCSPPPPPPPGVEGLEADGPITGSIRERMEQHRSDPACMSCHQAMDPIGFGLEHFGPTGRWRDQDGEYEIDATGELPGGATFDGAAELAPVLADDPRFTRCLTEKMMVYALGRGLESFDQRSVERIHREFLARGASLRDLILLVATSDPFLYRRGEPEGAEQ